MIYPVILCGGSGTRLWPLSRKSFPKQFVPIFEKKTLFDLTLKRCLNFNNNIKTVASVSHKFIVIDAIKNSNVNGTLILEPVARNTAAAMVSAALQHSMIGDENDLLLFCPADHFIPDLAAFENTILEGIKPANNGSIVCFGIVPTIPSPGFGYIKRGEEVGLNCFKMVEFTEKPSKTKAQSLLLEGNVFWNSGIFLASAKTIIAAANKHCVEILKHCKAALQDGFLEISDTSLSMVELQTDALKKCPSISFDHAVMEKHENNVVVPYAGQWSDVGSWTSFSELFDSDKFGNQIKGQGVMKDSRDSFVFAPDRPVVAIGVSGLVIVDTADAVLVAKKGSDEQIREVVNDLYNREIVQAFQHRKVMRPWGWYDSVDLGERFQVKRISVNPGASLSLQKHRYRAEHWVVVNGVAEVTCGDNIFLLNENQSTYIPVGTVHRLKNPGKEKLEMIEVQSGSYLGEDDIVRLDDLYGRVKGQKS